MKYNKDLRNDIAGASCATPGMLVCLIAAMFFSACESPPDYCSRGNRYDPNYEFCFAGKAYELCNGSKYNPLNQSCDLDRNTIGTRCLDNTVVPPGTPCGGYTLNTATVPENAGTIIRTPNKQNYNANEQVALSVTAGGGFTFTGWAGAVETANMTLTLTMDSNKPLVAIFHPASTAGAAAHTLVTTAFPKTGGKVLVNNTETTEASTHSNNAGLTVSAVAAQGYRFSGWSGALTSESSPATITMDNSKTLVAVFTPLVYSFRARANPANGGTVYVNGTALMGEVSQDAGTEVTALAQVAEGYIFTGWSGAADGMINPVKVTITNSNQTLTANFRQLKAEDGHGHFNPDINYGAITDARDGKKYRTVKIGEQTWMAENLNYDVPGIITDVCLDNDPSNCDIYGRLYDWVTAMSIRSEYNNAFWGESDVNHHGICPSGWHIPNDAEWVTLTNYVGEYDAVIKLKAKTGWDLGNGTDEFGFSALSSGGYCCLGEWWSATENDINTAMGLNMYYSHSNVSRSDYIKVFPLSVRCVKDGSSVTATYTVTTDVTPAGSGQIYRNFYYLNYPIGTSLTLTASPYNGYTFSHWSGTASGTSTTLSINNISQNHNITAHFTPITTGGGDD